MISKTKFNEYAADPSAFRADLMMDADGSVRRFGDIVEPWQSADFAALDAGLMRCNGRGTDPNAKMRAYFERARGHSKTTDLAVTCCWAMAFCTRPLKGYAFAADKDQAALLKDAMDRLIRLNPWLGEILEVQKNCVVNIAKGHPGSGGTLEIFTSDVASSYGILPDFIIADELTHWEGDGSLWHSIISSAAKRSTCLLVVISNAGFVDSWQWNIREVARTDDAWHFSRLDGPQASWLTSERLEALRRMLPDIAYRRLILNCWANSGGDALSTETIDAAFLDDLKPMEGRSEGWSFVAGVDLGLVRDGAAVVVLAFPAGGRAGKIRLAHHRLWRPPVGGKIDLLDVERHLLEIDERYALEYIGFDPWQAEHLAQTLEADAGHRRRNALRVHWAQPWMREIPPSPTNLRLQASLTIEFFNDRRIQLYDCEPLRRDLHKLRVEEKSYGMRLTSPRDGEGHGDSFSAFALALLMANEVAGKAPVVAGSWGDETDWANQWNARLAEYDKEMRELSKPDGNGLADALSEGRVTTITTPQFFH
jgi:hypothetical protein